MIGEPRSTGNKVTLVKAWIGLGFMHKKVDGDGPMAKEAFMRAKRLAESYGFDDFVESCVRQLQILEQRR